jgi:M6 family metalloprotease-like protein
MSLKDWRGVPAPVTRSGRGGVRLWVVLVLAVVGALLGAAAGPAVAQDGVGAFGDDDGSVHEAALDALASEGVLAGMECGEGLICPDEPLKRWEMAVWLVRVLDGADPAPVDAGRFVDVDAALWWAPFVERLFELAVTGGCASEPARFCPDRAVTRAQMATFLVRAFDVEDAPSAAFVDVDAAGAHAASIDALAAAGVTAGCSRDPLRYCPTGSVTRAQMATFLVRALGPIGLPEPVRFIAVDVGNSHGCGLRVDGTIACWGDNPDGQADAPAGSFSAVSAGVYSRLGHSCGLRVDGTVACWGANSHGQADPPEGRFTAISTGGRHSCGLRVDGTVACWGDDQKEQSSVPDGEFISLSSGLEHSCGLRVDGMVACWGSNAQAQTDVPSGHFSAVSAGGTHSCGLRSDSTIACWGGIYQSASNAPDGRFQMISAGYLSSCGLRVDGTIACWGDNHRGLADPPQESFDDVSVGGLFSCGLRSDGTIACWGDRLASPRDVPGGNFEAVTAGSEHACGLRVDGTVACWGNNFNGQAFSPSGRFSAVTAGAAQSCGLRPDGTLECWGERALEGADVLGGEFQAAAAGEGYSCGLRVNGRVSCWDVGYYRNLRTPRAVFTEIAAGDRFACGLLRDRTIDCWTAARETRPDSPDGRFDALSVGGAHGCGLRVDGTVACWGDNSDGQASAPDGRFISVSAGGLHSCGLRVDGTVACWGDNSDGQASAPDGQFQAIATGADYSCGVHDSGRIECWGSSTVVLPAGVSRVFSPGQPDPQHCRPFGTVAYSAGFPLIRPVSSTVGRLRIGVLFMDFPDAPAINTPQQEGLNGFGYIERYLESASYNKLRIDYVPLYRWLRAESNYGHYSGGTFRGQQMISGVRHEIVRLADPHFDFGRVDTVMIVFPGAHFSGGSAGHGLGTEEGDVPAVMVNNFVNPGSSSWGYVATHELAHDLGLADLYPLRAKRHFQPTIAPEGKRWRRVELGLMGLSSSVPVDDWISSVDTHALEMLAWSRWQLGWLASEQIRCINETTATVKLSPVADPGDGIAMAAVPLSAHEVIVVESRRRIGYDKRAVLGDGRVVVYTVDAHLRTGNLPVKLAGDVGRGHTYVSPVLAVGESVTVRGHTVTVVADDGETHTVTITRDGEG